jgi:hypothetical protein
VGHAFFIYPLVNLAGHGGCAQSEHQGASKNHVAHAVSFIESGGADGYYNQKPAIFILRCVTAAG